MKKYKKKVGNGGKIGKCEEKKNGNVEKVGKQGKVGIVEK